MRHILFSMRQNNFLLFSIFSNLGTAVDTAYSFVEDKPHGIYFSIEKLKADNHKAGALF
jgi:hypothetical protein